MNEPLSIKVFLAKGSSSSLRTAEISNWSGKAIACSRKELDDALKFLKDNCHLTDTGSEPTPLFTCGMGSYQFGKQFKDALNVK